jgi:SAM-dependent methyltransferase
MDSYNTVIQRIIPGVEFHQNRYAHELDAVIRDGCRWLDIGAGTRLHTGWRGPSEEELVARCRYVVGCDVEVLHLASNPALTAAVGADARRLPFADHSFDVVSANMVLEHLPAPEEVLREIARVLAPGGRFVFVTPHRGHPAVRLSCLLLPPLVRRRLATKVEGRAAEHVFLTYYAANSPRRLAELARLTGLRTGNLEVFASYPMFRRPLLLLILEALWIRAQAWSPLRRTFGSSLVGYLEKAAV